MPLVSILTPVYAEVYKYLSETIASVVSQKLPDRWEMEWIVQEDDKFPQLSNYFESLNFARYEASHAKFSIGHTRNLALSRARGELVQVLDHDDVLLPGALATLISTFQSNPVHWAVGQADDLMPDGRRVSFPTALPYGMLEPGVVNDWATSNNGNWPIHCAGLMMRTATLRGIGGWGGVPVDDDISMFAALSEISAGYNEPATTWLYRQHRQQTHRSAEWRRRGGEGRRIALERVAALRHTRLVLDHNSELSFGRPIPPLFAGELHPMKQKPAV